MKKTNLRAALFVGAALMVGTVSHANAALVNFGPSSASGSGPTINFLNLAAPTTIVGDATITFTVNGDLNSFTEYVDIGLDGFSLGRVFDNNSANDPFDFAGDQGNQSNSNLTGSATIASATMAGLIADGILNLTFNFSSNVNCCGTVNLLEGQISYDEAMSAVPVPAALPLLVGGLGLFGFIGLRRRRKTAAV